MAKKKLFLVDATAFCYRAFYAVRGLTTSSGQATNAVFGFTTMLSKLIREKKPEYLGVCFDVSRKTNRQEKFADYKGQRPPMPEGLSGQIPLIKDVVRAYRISTVEKEGFEADDVIATLAQQARDKGFEVVIVSSDKDILQLVDAGTLVFSPYKDEGTTYDTGKVFERFGVEPHQIPDIIALMGDTVDNIPGVAGIGEKTAVSLVKRFGTVEKLLEQVESIEQQKIRETIKESREMIALNKELAVLDRSVDLPCGPDELKMGEPDHQELFRLFKTFEFKSLLKELPVGVQRPGGAASGRASEAERGTEKALLAGAKEMVVYGPDASGLNAAVQGEAFPLDTESVEARRALGDPAIKKIGHDLKKLKVLLARQGAAFEGLYFDAMLAAYCINPSQAGYGLVDIAWEYLHEAIQEGSLDSGQAIALIMRLRPVLEKEIEERELSRLFRDIEMPLSAVLADMEVAGIRLDTKVLRDLSRDIEKKLTRLIDEIYALSGTEFNINSPKQLREILFEKLKLPVVRRSKTGPSTDERVLRALAGRHPLPALLLDYRQLMKLKTTYVDTLPELVDPKTGRLHTLFNQTGTETGRLSSVQPNLQNIPIKTQIGRSIRKAIVSSGKETVLLSCDYSQVELRILAHLSGDERLIEAFKEGKDVHRMTAALTYGVDEESVEDAMRETAKRINFGIVYGLTSFGLSQDLEIPLDEAQGFIDEYFARYPRVRDYIEEQIERARHDGFVTTIVGRRRYIPDINNKNPGMRQFAERQAVNTPIQGSASDLIKLAMIDIHKDIIDKKLASRMLLQVHDELVFDVPVGEMDTFAPLVKDKMERVLELAVPVKVDMKQGKNWLEMEEIR